MTADLAKILFFADAEGRLHETPQRKMFCVIDGILGGEGMGPLEPDAKPCGCLIAGHHPLAVDLLATRLMGFDPRKLRQFDVAFQEGWDFGLASLAEIEVRKAGQVKPVSDLFSPANRERFFAFNPHPGWVGRVEA